MDFSLNEDQVAFRDAARDFAAGEMAPFAAEWDEKKIFPKDVFKKAGALGFMGMYCPADIFHLLRFWFMLVVTGLCVPFWFDVFFPYCSGD